VSVIVVGLEQKHAPLELLDRVSVTEVDTPKALGRLRDQPNLSEAVLLSTCLRTEVYAVVERFHDGVAEIQEFLATPDFDSAVAWVEEHGKADYMSTKQAMCAYVAGQAFPLLKQGIRINAICPGPTDTPLAQANKEMWLGFGSDYRGEAGIEAATPLEQAYPLVFLCSDAASAITGIIMITDAGYMSSGITGSFPGATAIANMLLFR